MKNKIHKMGLLLLLFIMPFSLFSQINKNEISLLVKLALFQESLGLTGYTADQNALEDFLKLEFKLDTLNTKGFENFLFVSVSPIFKNPQNVSLEKGPLVPDNCDKYILAIERQQKSIYKLKGFRINDFAFLLLRLNELNYQHIRSLNNFIRYYSVDDLDLKCLYKAFKATKLQRSKYKCLSTCTEMTYIN